MNHLVLASSEEEQDGLERLAVSFATFRWRRFFPEHADAQPRIAVASGRDRQGVRTVRKTCDPAEVDRAVRREAVEIEPLGRAGVERAADRRALGRVDHAPHGPAA